MLNGHEYNFKQRGPGTLRKSLWNAIWVRWWAKPYEYLGNENSRGNSAGDLRRTIPRMFKEQQVGRMAEGELQQSKSKRQWFGRGAANVGSCLFYEPCLYSGYNGVPSNFFWVTWYDLCSRRAVSDVF